LIWNLLNIIIIELYDVGNIAGLGFEKGDPDEKTLPQIIKFRKQRFRFEHVIFKRFHIKRNKIVKDFKQCLDN
jgi:hypothetical protein